MANKIFYFNPSSLFPRDYRQSKSNSTKEIYGVIDYVYDYRAFDGYYKKRDSDFYQNRTLYLDCGSQGSLRKNITTRTLFVISDDGLINILYQKQYDTSIKNVNWALDFIDIAKEFLSNNPYQSIDTIELEINGIVLDNITDINITHKHKNTKKTAGFNGQL